MSDEVISPIEERELDQFPFGRDPDSSSAVIQYYYSMPEPSGSLALWTGGYRTLFEDQLSYNALEDMFHAAGKTLPKDLPRKLLRPLAEADRQWRLKNPGQSPGHEILLDSYK
jgi:hypothetical protein